MYLVLMDVRKIYKEEVIMKILIASDSFKGSLTSMDICQIAKDAIEASIPDAVVITMPLADGGEGSVEALVENTHGNYHTCSVTGPFNDTVQATYGILGDNETAVIEMSSASGIILATREELDPLVATSYGTGELILDAIKNGCSKIIMGIGGSATNDGGAGMLQALGFDLLDSQGKQIGLGGVHLIDLVTISSDHVDKKILEVELLVACDVNNPLIGKSGATHVYGPQKGATPSIIEQLEEGMENFGSVIEWCFKKSVLFEPGAGAAGGMGAGFLGCLNATLDSGFKIISEQIGLEEIVKNQKFDYIFTGEGQLNHQTLNGKLPFGMATLGKKYNIPVIVIAGSLSKGYELMYDAGMVAAFSIINSPMELDYAIKNAKELLYETYTNIAKLIKNQVY